MATVIIYSNFSRPRGNIVDGRCTVCENSEIFCRCDLSGETCEMCDEPIEICVRLKQQHEQEHSQV
jgi:hypothetical protein